MASTNLHTLKKTSHRLKRLFHILNRFFEFYFSCNFVFLNDFVRNKVLSAMGGRIGGGGLVNEHLGFT